MKPGPISLSALVMLVVTTSTAAAQQLAPPAAESPKTKLSVAELQQIGAALTGKDAKSIQDACDALVTAEVDPRAQPAVCLALEKLMTTGGSTIRMHACTALVSWGRPQSMPLVMQTARDPVAAVRHRGIAALGRSKSATAGPVLARWLKDPRADFRQQPRELDVAQDRRVIGRALMAAGPQARSYLAKLATDSDADVAALAGEIIKYYDSLEAGGASTK